MESRELLLYRSQTTYLRQAHAAGNRCSRLGVGVQRKASTKLRALVREQLQGASTCTEASFPRDTATSSAEVAVEPVKPQQKTLWSSDWPQKSSLYLLRTDGKSCSRELVSGNGKLHFAYPSTQQHLMVWRNRPKSVMVLKKLGNALNTEFMEVVRYLGDVERLRVVVEPSMYKYVMEHHQDISRSVFTFTDEESPRLHEKVDFVVCLGGDGVILHACHLFKSSIPPVISFNLGSMGFLTNHRFENFRSDLREVIYGSQKLATCSMDGLASSDGNCLGVHVTLRMRLLCEIFRRGQSRPEQQYEVLNEVVVDRGSNSFLTNVECYINGRMITRVQADGVMLATPTGSTAYSVAAGGSMVHPNVPAILLTPICPHSLNFRPVVLPDYVELELRVPDETRCSAWVCFDGKCRQELNRGDRIFVRMSESPVPTINEQDLTMDWFDSLNRCFNWSNRLVQQALEIPQEEKTGNGMEVVANGNGKQ